MSAADNPDYLRHPNLSKDRFLQVRVWTRKGVTHIESVGEEMDFFTMSQLRKPVSLEKLAYNLSEGGPGQVFSGIGVSSIVTLGTNGKLFLPITKKGSVISGYCPVSQLASGFTATNLLYKAFSELTEEMLPITLDGKIMQGNAGDFEFNKPYSGTLEYSATAYNVTPDLMLNGFPNHRKEVVINGVPMREVDHPLKEYFYGIHFDRFHNNAQFLIFGHIELEKVKALYHAETVVLGKEEAERCGHMYADVLEKDGLYLLPVDHKHLVGELLQLKNRQAYHIKRPHFGLSELFGGLDGNSITLKEKTYI